MPPYGGVVGSSLASLWPLALRWMRFAFEAVSIVTAWPLLRGAGSGLGLGRSQGTSTQRRGALSWKRHRVGVLASPADGPATPRGSPGSCTLGTVQGDEVAVWPYTRRSAQRLQRGGRHPGWPDRAGMDRRLCWHPVRYSQCRGTLPGVRDAPGGAAAVKDKARQSARAESRWTASFGWCAKRTLRRPLQVGRRPRLPLHPHSLLLRPPPPLARRRTRTSRASGTWRGRGTSSSTCDLSKDLPSRSRASRAASASWLWPRHPSHSPVILR